MLKFVVFGSLKGVLLVFEHRCFFLNDLDTVIGAVEKNSSMEFTFKFKAFVTTAKFQTSAFHAIRFKISHLPGSMNKADPVLFIELFGSTRFE